MDAALKENNLDWKETVIQRLANHCNDKKLASKRVSQASDEMFLASFIKECGPYDVKGMVLKVCFDVIHITLTTEDYYFYFCEYYKKPHYKYKYVSV